VLSGILWCCGLVKTEVFISREGCRRYERRLLRRRVNSNLFVKVADRHGVILGNFVSEGWSLRSELRQDISTARTLCEILVILNRCMWAKLLRKLGEVLITISC
jgi:hypothetical protein